MAVQASHLSKITSTREVNRVDEVLEAKTQPHKPTPQETLRTNNFTEPIRITLDNSLKISDMPIKIYQSKKRKV